MNYTVGQKLLGGAIVVAAVDTTTQTVTLTFPELTSPEGAFSATYDYGVPLATVAAAYDAAALGR